MGAATKWQRMVLQQGNQYNVNLRYVPALVELKVIVTNHRGDVLGTALICRNFYFTFELFKHGKKRTGKRKLSDYCSSHEPKEYGSAVANWIIKNHIPRYTD